MTLGSRFFSTVRQIRFIAALVYLVAIICLASITGWNASGLYSDYMTVGALHDRLAQLDARVEGSTPDASTEGPASGSPFIDGATITQAGAALQQRIERAVVRAAGSIISSQVEIGDQQAKAGSIRLVAELEISQPAIQGFLYDLEAGTPYLFVDTLSMQSPQGTGDHDGSSIHLSMGVSGQWQARP